VQCLVDGRLSGRKETMMAESAMFEHEMEQINTALAQSLSEETDVNLRETVDVVDCFTGEFARWRETAGGAEPAEFGYFLLREKLTNS
jgi:hypothetical protein